MAHAPDKLMTAEELSALGDIGRCELIRGELIRMSPSNPRHGVLTAYLCHRLELHVLENHLGLVMGAETGFTIATDPDTVRAPDVAFIAFPRANNLPERGFFEGAPDLAVEVVSPSDSFSEVQAKAQNWLTAGCRAVWIVDPTTRSVTECLPNGTNRVLHANDDLNGGDVLPEFHLPVSEIFQSLPK